MTQTPTLVRVERAAGDLRRGQPVVVTEDGRDAVLVVAAELVTDARLDQLRGLAGAEPDLALTHRRAATLKIRLYTEPVVMVPLPPRATADLVRSLADPATDLSHPLRGPFDARREPLSAAKRAAVELAKIAGLLPAVLVAPPRGDLAHDLLRVDHAEITGYDLAAALGLEMVTSAPVPLADAEKSRILAFRPRDGGLEHFAIVIGDPLASEPVLVRLHSECFTGDLLGSLKCDCGEQLRGAIREIGKAGAGILLYLRQEGRGIGLINKLRAYALQGQGFDTVEANQRLGFEPDEREFLAAAEILRRLGFKRVRLMTNNPDKVAALAEHGIEVVERVPHAFPANEHNAFYLATKAKKSGHLL
jgi:GTP cyclohydrolase II